MSEHHHAGGHSHGHSHAGGGHSRSGEGAGEMTFAERMKTLLSHWLDHNADHAATYRQWAGKARAEGMEAVAERLEEAAEKTLSINETFEAASRRIG